MPLKQAVKLKTTRLIERIFSEIDFFVINYCKDKEAAKLIKSAMKEEPPFTQKPSELLTLYSLAKNQRNIEGDYAEVGVFKGVSAKIICEAKGEKELHLFDAFAGLPTIEMFLGNYEKIKQKLSPYKNVNIYKGMFPEKTGDVVQNKKFSLVHLDVDLYGSMKDCLDFFYPRMLKSGIIVSHDYYDKEIKNAFNEFIKDKPESIIQLPISQCMIIKQ